MRKSWSGAYAVLGCIVAMGLTAQAVLPSQLRSSSAEHHVIVTGCVELAALDPARTTGTTEPGLTDATFLLTNAIPSKFEPAKAPETTDLNPFAGTTFRLVAPAMLLAPHIGQRVEIAGTVENEFSVKTSVTEPLPASTSAAPAPKLTVESIQMVTAMCSNVVVRR